MRELVSQRLWHAASAAVLILCAASSLPAQTPAVASRDEMVTHEIRALEIIGGGSVLTPAERQSAAQIVSDAMRVAPERWRQLDAQNAKNLAEYATRGEAYHDLFREVVRDSVEFSEAQNTALAPVLAAEKAIIEAHDPVVAIDRVHKRLVTQHTLVVLRQTATWVAKNYNEPPPSARFEAIVAARLPQVLAAETAQGDGLAHVERNAMAGREYIASLPKETRAGLFSNRSDFTQLKTADDEQWLLALDAGILSRFGANHVYGSGGLSGSLAGMLASQQRQLKMLQGAAMGASPACNINNGSYEDRAASGCYPH